MVGGLPVGAEPACSGIDPEVFTDALHQERALATCDRCPVVDWCLTHVDPARAGFSGVAGGQAWHEGGWISPGRANRTTTLYLEGLELQERTQAHTAARERGEPDPVAVHHFITGRLQWGEVSLVDRLAAARHMTAAGRMSRSAIQAFCHIGHRLLREAQKRHAA